MYMVQKLYALDKQLQQAVQRRFHSKFHYKESKHYDPERFLSGSAVEVGMLCRSLPRRQFEVELDIMIPQGTLTREMGNKFLYQVEGHPGYFMLRPSPTAEYLRPHFRDHLQNPDKHETSYKYLNVFTYADNHTVDTALMKEYMESDSRDHNPFKSPGVVDDGPSNASQYPLIDLMQRYLSKSPLLYCFFERTTSVSSIDSVLCFHLDYVPDCIMSWILHFDNR